MQVKATIECTPTRTAKIKKNDHSKVWLVVHSYTVEGNIKCYKLAMFVPKLDIHLSYDPTMSLRGGSKPSRNERSAHQKHVLGSLK